MRAVLHLLSESVKVTALHVIVVARRCYVLVNKLGAVVRTA